MNTPSLQPTNHVSKFLQILQPHSWRIAKPIGDTPTNQEPVESMHPTQTRPDLRPTYSLEQRTFL
jgi:hypothetical protein